MKSLKFCETLWYLGLPLLLVIMACEPIVDDQDRGNTANLDDIEVFAEQNPAGSNIVTLKTTPGVAGNWNYGIGVAHSDKVTFATPIRGTQTFTFSGNLGAEYFTKDIDVTIDNFVEGSVDEEWSLLAGNDPNVGKTWVFDGSPGDGTLWFYMSPNGGPQQWQDVWWNAGGTCCPPPDAGGKMTFDLNGAANYTYIGNGAERKATFSIDVENMKLKILGGENVLGGYGARGNPIGEYSIAVLSEDRLVLWHRPETGWTWVFKPEE